MKSASDSILRRIRAKQRGWVFTPKDFVDIAPRNNVGVVLHRLVDKGVIRKIGHGIYDFPIQHPKLGTLSANPDAIARAVAVRAGDTIQPGGAQLANQLGFDTQVFLFELDQSLLLNKCIPVFRSLSKYPSVRRDLALIVKEDVSASELINCIKASSEPALQDVIIFDIYRGKGVEEGNKSVALSLIIQDDTQTLTDSEIDAIVSRLLILLNNEKNAKLRD